MILTLEKLDVRYSVFVHLLVDIGLFYPNPIGSATIVGDNGRWYNLHKGFQNYLTGFVYDITIVHVCDRSLCKYFVKSLKNELNLKSKYYTVINHINIW